LDFTLRSLDARAQTIDFDCGERVLNEYLQRYASQDIKRGLGAILLADACMRVTAASETLGVAAIVVDAKSAKAAAFYQHFGFIALSGQEGRWLLPRSHFSGVI